MSQRPSPPDDPAPDSGLESGPDTAYAAALKRLPAGMRTDKRGFRSDLAAGFTGAIVSIPSAMGHALLATVNPVAGLVALAIGTPIAALFTSSVFMNVSTTSAISVAVGDVMRPIPAALQPGMLATLVLMVGVLQLLAALFRLGSLLRFVSNAVMTGFATGVALLIILSQLGDLTGFESTFRNRVLQVADLLLNLGEINWTVLAVSVLTALLILGFGYTPLRKFAMILALGIITAAAYFLIPGQVPTVQDVALIPNRIFQEIVIDFAIAPYLLTSAAAIVIISLVQGASVSQVFPNPDGRFPNASRDFMGQGLANAAVSVANGLPVGGSTSGTIVNVASGAHSRWSNVLAGLFIAPLVFLLTPVINVVPMAAIAALLFVAAVQSISFSKLHLVWVTGYAPRTAMLITLVSALVLPLQYAIFVGVAISIFLSVVQQADKLVVKQIEVPERGFPVESDAPARLESNSVTTLMLYGSLSFAAASNLEKLLPPPGNATHAAVVLGMRFNTEIGSTFVTVLRRYDETLRKNQCRLYLAGVQPEVLEQLRRTRLIDLLGEEQVVAATPEIGRAMNEALARANAWVQSGPSRGE